jgi:hypothetical protein
MSGHHSGNPSGGGPKFVGWDGSLSGAFGGGMGGENKMAGLGSVVSNPQIVDIDSCSELLTQL